MIEGLLTGNLLDIQKTIAGESFKKAQYPWEVLGNINSIIMAIGEHLLADRYTRQEKDIWVAKSAKITDSAYIKGPLIIDEYVEIRHCAFIRGSVIIGKESVVGNSVELKNSILFDKVQVPHYNYVGDSILGYKAHMGAGSITSNVKSDKSEIAVNIREQKVYTGFRKFGAILGDRTEIGCNSVLNPGSVIGRRSIIYPLSSVRGYVGEDSIYKDKDNVARFIN